MRLQFLLATLLLGLNSLLHAQSGSNPEVDYTSEVQKMANVPNSPEAQAFATYGNTAVSLYTGQPNIAVPLYEYQGRELSLPMSLTYDASGIKVDQIATQTGLGWNLQFGGRISRVINGAPDDYVTAFPAYETIMNSAVRSDILKYYDNNETFETENAARAYLHFIKNIQTGFTDTQPDYYNLNALGINGYIAFDLANMEAKVLNNPRIKVEATFSPSNNSLESWAVTGEDGTQFIFEVAEKTYTQGNDYSTPSDSPELYGILKEYNSSWLLTRIISPLGKDDYELNYTFLGSWTDMESYSGASSVLNNSCDNNQRPDEYSDQVGQISYFEQAYKIDQHFLSTVYHNGSKIISFDLGNRYDLSIASALTGIKIHHPADPGNIIREFDFTYSYFGIGQGVSPVGRARQDIRLKLDKVAFKDPLSTDHTYRFSYIQPEAIPSRTSFSRDYLGYYNGYDNNVLYPAMTINEDTYAGANRDPNIDYALIGSLDKIYYPTGGFTEFTFGLPYTSKEQKGGTRTEQGLIGRSSVNGGIDPNNADESPWPHYEDKYGEGNYPKIATNTFQVNRPGSFDVRLFSTGGIIEAHLVKIASPGQTLKWNEILDGGGGYQVPYYWADAISGGTGNGYLDYDPLFLEVGTYQLLILNPAEGQSSSVEVHGKYLVQVPDQTIKEYKAGQRIEKLANYTSEGELASLKEYKYTTTLDGDASSAQVVFNPLLRHQVVRQVLLYEPDARNIRINHCGYKKGINYTRYEKRLSTAGGGTQPHIAYSTVFEIRKTGFNKQEHEGYTKYDFHVGKSGLISSGAPPYANAYYMNYDNGKERQVAVYNQDNLLLSENIPSYGGKTYFSSKGLYAVFREENTYRFPMIHQSSSTGEYLIEYVNPELWQWIGLGTPGPLTPLPPKSCDLPGNHCIADFQYSSYGIARTFASGQVDYTVEVNATEYVYDPDGNATPITTRTAMEYESAVDYLNTTTTVWGSDGEININRKYYPKHFNNFPYTALQNDNKLATVVEQESFTNGVRNLHRKIKYALNNGRAVPVKVAMGSAGPLEDRIAFDYDDDQNLKQAIQISDPAVGASSSDFTTAYLWGYNKRFMVAKIDNATQTEVDAALGSAATILDDPSPTDADLRNTLGILRENLPNAQVTLYTHQYNAGITSMTDPNGIVTRYEYDDMLRVKAIYQSERKIQEFAYKYLTQE